MELTIAVRRALSTARWAPIMALVRPIWRIVGRCLRVLRAVDVERHSKHLDGPVVLHRDAVRGPVRISWRRS